MPESKKRQSPVVGHNKSLKQGLSSDHDRQSAVTPEIPIEPLIQEAGEVLEKYPTPPPPAPIDIMKTEPLLYPYIIETYTGNYDENGFYHGEGCARLKSGVSYKGNFDHGSMHGQGKLIWPNGTVFVGNITQNSMTGKGIYSWPDGSSYDGETVNGLRHGFGIFKCADGIKSYAGQWVKGKRNGKGVMYYDIIGASYYDGEWIDNQKNGYGIRRFKNGNVYEGYWKSNSRQGHGTMRWYDLGQEYSGSWENGLQHGEGENIWYLKRVNTTQYPLRNYYIGNFVNGERHGFGSFYYASGASYEGEWKQNMKHGSGKFTFKNGYIFTGKFRDDHMIDFPELILSGMTTPDIARTGIPVKSPGPLRADSIMGVPNKGNDVFLDIDIEELLMDYSYDLERRQIEVDNILRLLLRHTSHLKQLYKIYSCLGEDLTIDKTTLMNKFQFFRFLKDYGIHRLGYSIMELDRLIGEDYNGQDYCYRKIFLRDFLNALIRISHVLFKDEIDEECENVVSACFNLLLKYLLVPPETVQINGYIFTSVEKCQEVMKHFDLFIDMYYHFSSTRLKNDELSLTQRHLVFIFDELGLFQSGDLTTTKLVDIITIEDREEECYFNLELMVSPLEFIEVVVGCANVFVSLDVLRKHQCVPEEENKSEILEIDSTDVQVDNAVVNANVSIEDSNNKEKEENKSSPESTTKPGYQNVANLAADTVATSVVQSSKSSNKLASKTSKKNKCENRKIDRETSKDQIANKQREKRDEKKPLGGQEKSNLPNNAKGSENSKSPSSGKGKSAPDGQQITSVEHAKEKAAETTNNEQTSVTTIPVNESNDITTAISHQVTETDGTIPELLSFDHFEGWSAKLNVFVEYYLKPAYEKSLMKFEKSNSKSPDQLCVYVSSPNASIMKV